MDAAVSIHNTTDDTFTFRAGMNKFHNPPQSIGPGEKVELHYDNGTPTTGCYFTSEGQVYIRVGNPTQPGGVDAQGSYGIKFAGSYEIVKGRGW
jgi:hypothetical protein